MAWKLALIIFGAYVIGACVYAIAWAIRHKKGQP